MSIRHLKSMLALCSLVAGCGSGVSGDYGGPHCFYEKLSFKSDGVVHVTALGVHESKYKVNDTEITVTDNEGKVIVFKKNGDALEGDLLGQKIVCRKL
jgi:hypothetical protein